MLFLHKKHRPPSTHKHQSPLPTPIHKHQNPFPSTHKHRSPPPTPIHKSIKFKFKIVHFLSVDLSVCSCASMCWFVSIKFKFKIVHFLSVDLFVCSCASMCWFVCVGVFVCIKGRRRWWGEQNYEFVLQMEKREKMSEIMKLIKYYVAKLQ